MQGCKRQAGMQNSKSQAGMQADDRQAVRYLLKIKTEMYCFKRRPWGSKWKQSSKPVTLQKDLKVKKIFAPF
jgi:hypothetical protein